MRAVVAIAIALTCQRAHADSPPPEPDRPVVASYRGTTLAFDGIALGLVVAADAADAPFLAVLGAGTYVVGAPIAHMTNQRYGRAAASMAMRVGLPLLGLIIGDNLPRDCGPSGDCNGSPVALYLGFAAGVVTASAVDAIFLADGDPKPSQPKATWAPVAGPTRDGFALGIAGQF